MCHNNIRKHIKGTIYSLLFQDTKFLVQKSGLRALLQILYKRAKITTCHQSIQKKQKENDNNSYMPCCLCSRTCLVSGSTRSSSKKFKELKSEQNSVNDNIMQVLGWLIQNRIKSFIMQQTLNLDNIYYSNRVGIQHQTTRYIINQTHP